MAVALPAVAHADPDKREHRSERRADSGERGRDSRSDDRSDKAKPERPVRVERTERSVSRVIAPPERRNEATPERRNEASPEQRARFEQYVRERRAATGADARSDPGPSGDSVRDWRQSERSARRSRDGGVTSSGNTAPVEATTRDTRRDLGESVAERLRERQREGRTVESGVRRPDPFRNLRDGRSADNFRHQWRGDRRYDWRHHRERNRHLFHLGWYHDPFGWGYRRFNIGWSIGPSYWSDRYWLQDPWQWRLPSVYGSYRWIRYYDDALLVDLRTGRVVDVIPDFFW